MAHMGRQGDRTERLGIGLVLLGCGLFVVAMFVPVMRWSVNAKHESAGDARIWIGDDWTLSDGGFEGAWLLPFGTAAVLLLAAAMLSARWRAQVALACVVGYVPAWTAVAFARKLEDQVAPDIGVALLALSAVAIMGGLWLRRPLRDSNEQPAERTDAPARSPRPT